MFDRNSLRHKLKKFRVIYILVPLFIIFLIGISDDVFAIEPINQLHLNLQILHGDGSIQTGTFDFVFNISADDSCSDIVYSKPTSLATDSRGVISYYLEDVNMAFDEQYWLCYYRDSVLKGNSPIAKTPYSFEATNVSASGIKNDSNLVLDNHNISAMFGFFNLSWDYIYDYPTNLDLDSTDDLTTGTTLGGDVSGIYNNLQLGTGVILASNINTSNGVSDNKVLAYNATSGRLYWKTDETGSGGGGTIDGSGTAEYYAKWTDSDTLSNSSIFENSTGIYIG